MASTIKVTASGITNGINTLNELNAEFLAEITELVSTESSLNSMWEGEAHDSFHAAFTSDKSQMETFNKEITNYATTLQEILNLYEEAEAINLDTAVTRTYR